MKARIERYIDWLDRLVIYNPHPQDLAPGMMCRPGIVIKEVDGEQVLVGHSIGGRRERWVWTHYSEITEVWRRNKGGESFEAAMEQIEAFGRAVTLGATGRHPEYQVLLTQTAAGRWEVTFDGSPVGHVTREGNRDRWYAWVGEGGRPVRSASRRNDAVRAVCAWVRAAERDRGR